MTLKHRPIRLSPSSIILEIVLPQTLKQFDLLSKRSVSYDTARINSPVYSANLGSQILHVCREDNGQSQTIVHVLDLFSGSTIYDTRVKHSIRRVVHRSGIVCLVGEKIISVIRDDDGSLIKQQTTISNPSGCCDVSSDPERRVICCPGLQRGTLRVERLYQEESSSSVIAAHDRSLQAVAVSADGAFVASVSETGTLIRLHSTIEPCDLLIELRRTSLLRPPKISELFVSPTGSFLGTVDEKTFLISIYKTPVSVSSHLLDRSEGEKSPLSVISSIASIVGGSAWSSFKVPSMNSTISFVTATFGPDPYTVIVGAMTSAGPVGFLYRFDPVESNTITLAKCEYIDNTTANEDEIIPLEKPETVKASNSDGIDDWTLLSFSTEESLYTSW